MKITLIILILGCSLFTKIAAQIPMSSSFTYQGELRDGGSPANDNYDFQIALLNSQGQQVGAISEHINITVEEGLFSVNVNFGIDAFDGIQNYYIEVSVRKTSNGGVYTPLNPLQRLRAVPLATNLTNGNATPGQVLTFNGSQWSPADIPASPWVENIGEVFYNGSMFIGGSAFINESFTVSGLSRLLGVTHFTQNTAQPTAYNGQLKYMANFWCGNGSTTVNRFYNGTFSAGNISVTGGPTSGSCEVVFPDNINNRYWNASADSNLARGVNCSIGATNNKLSCIRYKISDGADASGNINILIY
ncbi:MAG: hypothetical protein R3F25_08840 [Gammaproteobacteria bacterium]|jgi:hypothetical protein|nr:hypothetical protein [Xanthomonadales bacterium]